MKPTKRMSGTGSSSQSGAAGASYCLKPKERDRGKTDNPPKVGEKFTKDMVRFLLLSFFVVITSPNGTFEKPVHGDFRSILQVDFSDATDPANDLQTKRNSYPNPHESEVLNPADPSSLCYFIQESETESQISCRLRFTRSKFNFNPFGLRFGKRQGGILADDQKLGSQSSSKILQDLLKPRLDRMINQCEETWGDGC